MEKILDVAAIIFRINRVKTNQVAFKDESLKRSEIPNDDEFYEGVVKSLHAETAQRAVVVDSKPVAAADTIQVTMKEKKAAEKQAGDRARQRDKILKMPINIKMSDDQMRTFARLTQRGKIEFTNKLTEEARAKLLSDFDQT